MVFLATFMPAADVEICIGMIGVPLSLFLLSKNNCGVSAPNPCKVVEDEVRSVPVEADPEEEEKEREEIQKKEKKKKEKKKEKHSDAEQSLTQGSCSPSLGDGMVECETQLTTTSSMDITSSMSEEVHHEDVAACETEDISASETEMVDDFAVPEKDQRQRWWMISLFLKKIKKKMRMLKVQKETSLLRIRCVGLTLRRRTMPSWINWL